MKIMYFMDNGQILGGAAHTLLRQAELMKAAGHDVVVVLDDGCGSDGLCEAYMTFCSQRNISTLAFPIYAVNQPEDLDVLFILRYFSCTKERIEAERPDILHSLQINVVVELAARELNIPHIMNIYPAIPAFFAIKYTDVFPKYHICDSEYYAGMWERYFHTNSICIRTVASHAKEYRNSLKKHQMIKGICVGAVYKSKNQLSVIRACHKAIENGINIKLSVYGNYAGSSYGEECIDYIRRHGLEPYIELKGFFDDMSSVYQESDILICGSKRESYPNVISEALANGVVIISTPVAGVPEVIKDRQNGYLCSGYTADDIYEKITELEKDIESGMICGIMQKANKTYESLHSPESVSVRLESYYCRLLKNFESKKTVGIDSLKTAFQEITKTYFQKEKMFSHKDKIQKKLWYLYHVQDRIREQIEEKKYFYIWGTGQYGKVVYELLTAFFEDMKIPGFIDSFKTGSYMERPISRPKDVLDHRENIIVIATVNGQEDIIEQLEKNNRKYIEDYYILSQRWW